MDALQRERERGKQLAEQLVEHLKAMLAERAEIPVGEYVVIVERRTERREDGR